MLPNDERSEMMLLFGGKNKIVMLFGLKNSENGMLLRFGHEIVYMFLEKFS